MKEYLEMKAEEYGVFISDLRCDCFLREETLLDLAQKADQYSIQELNEAVSYLENHTVRLTHPDEVRQQIFRYLGIAKDHLVIGSNECGDLILDEDDQIYLILCEPGTHPVGTAIENMEDAVYLGENRNDV